MNAPLLTPVLAWDSSLFWVIAISFGTLGVGTIVRLTALRGRSDKKATDRRNSLKTWWCVVAIVVGIVSIGRVAAIVVFGLLSALAFLEFMRLTQPAASTEPPSEDLTTSVRSESHRDLTAVALFLIPVHYLSLWLYPSAWTMALLPVGALLVGSIILVVTGQAAGYASHLGRTYLGLIFTTYFLSHTVLLFKTTGLESSLLDASACFLYIITLTELDDISQALVGRRIGKHKLSRIVSPNKTWEGFVGGMLVTIVLSIILGHFLISSDWVESSMLGIVIAIAALFGDLNMSAFKRDAGVKDSGNWLPGHGGLLDRIDSLTFTAPVFYYVYFQPISL